MCCYPGNAYTCPNRQNEVRVTYGRHAKVEPNNRWYHVETMIKFSCPKTFYLVDQYGKKKDPFIWLKCTLNHGWNHGWNHPWPKCRGWYIICFTVLVSRLAQGRCGVRVPFSM